VLAAAVDVRYRPLILFAAYTGLRPCELVALRVGRLDLLRCTAQVVETSVEVSRLEWGPVKTHEARTVRMPRSVAEEVAASLAGRPHNREALVFTAPMGGPLGRADFVKNYFRPAVRAANEAVAKLPWGSAPGAAAERSAVLRPAAYLRQPAHRPRRERQGGAGAARARDRQHHAGHLRAPVPV
jgi:integrase